MPKYSRSSQIKPTDKQKKKPNSRHPKKFCFSFLGELINLVPRLKPRAVTRKAEKRCIKVSRFFKIEYKS